MKAKFSIGVAGLTTMLTVAEPAAKFPAAGCDALKTTVPAPVMLTTFESEIVAGPETTL
jgi:hypothetical protein